MPLKRYNLNPARNGTRLARLVVGELPKELLSVKREGRQYRRFLEAACVEAHDQVDTMAAHHIDTATAGQVHAGVCRWILRNKWSKMTPQDILKCSAEILRAKEGRDRAVRLLKLGSGKDSLDAFYSPERVATSQEPDSGGNGSPHDEGPSDAADGRTGGQMTREGSA